MAALLLLVPVLMLHGGEVLTVTGSPAWAQQMPGNAALVARYRLPYLHGENMEAAGTQLSTRALRETLIVQPALSWLAFETPVNSREPDLARLTDSLGWRDAFSERALYNFALESNAPAEAMTHANALLQQGLDQQVLSEALIKGAGNPRFLAAMRGVFASQNRWSARWLLEHGAELTDDALMALAAAQAASPSGLPHATLGAIIRKLLSQSRFAAAKVLWSLSGGRGFTGEQPWPEGDKLASPAPFDWQIGAGVTISAEDVRRLVAERLTPNTTAHRLILLETGTYVLVVSGNPARATGWRWDVGCGTGPRPGQRAFGADNRFTVAADCPIQWLSVSATSPEALGEPLPPLRLEPVP